MIFRFRYTGWGWVSLTSVVAATLISLIAGLGFGTEKFGEKFGWLAAGILMLVAAGLHHLLAMTLNSTVTPQGRVWHNRNTFTGMPMQLSGTLPFVAFALIGVAVSIGEWTSALVGLIFFVVAFVALLAVAFRLHGQGGLRRRA